MQSFVVKVVVNAVAIWVATVLVDDVTVSGRATDTTGGTVLRIDHFWPTAVLAAVVVGVVGFVLRLVLPDGDR